MWFNSNLQGDKRGQQVVTESVMYRKYIKLAHNFCIRKSSSFSSFIQIKKCQLIYFYKYVCIYIVMNINNSVFNVTSVLNLQFMCFIYVFILHLDTFFMKINFTCTFAIIKHTFSFYVENTISKLVLLSGLRAPNIPQHLDPIIWRLVFVYLYLFTSLLFHIFIHLFILCASIHPKISPRIFSVATFKGNQSYPVSIGKL